MLYRIDDFELDTENFELRQSGVRRHVEPKVFDLLCYLSKNNGRVLTRDEIIEHVWQGRIVSDTTISSAIKSARKALGDSGASQNYIRTVRGRGFQFVADVECSELANEEKFAKSSHIVTAKMSNQIGPSLIILPFQIFGDAPEHNAVGDGLVENLTTILTRVPFLSLTSRAQSFALKGTPVNFSDIRQKFQVTYMLEGSLQKLGGQLRANVQLIDTQNGFHIWAQQFDVVSGDDAMLNLLDAILPRLEPQLVQAMFNDLRDESGELTGRQLLLQAMGILSLKGWHKDTFVEATTSLNRAIQLEPDLALAHGYLALILGLGHRVGLIATSGDIAAETVMEAERAMELAGMDSNVLGLAGCALADIGQADRALPILKNALDINQNNGQALASLGSAYMVLGKTESAIKYLTKGIDISPHDSRLAVWYAVLGIAYLFVGDFKAAKIAAEEGCQNNDKTYLPRVVLTAALIELGDEKSAKIAYGECLRVKPDLSQSEIYFLIGPDFGEKLVCLGQ